MHLVPRNQNPDADVLGMGGRKTCHHALLGVIWRYENGGSCRQCRKARVREQRTDPIFVATQRDRDRARYPKRKPSQIAKARQRQGMVFAPGESLQSLLDAQDYRCPVCTCDLTVVESKDVHVDHNHILVDGRPNVRGVLCADCNLGMGRYADSIENHLRAIEYLRKAAASGR